MILNEQKQIWCWRERLFLILTTGAIFELQFWYSKNGYNYYMEHNIDKSSIVARIIVKSKVDHVATVRTGKLTYKK